MYTASDHNSKALNHGDTEDTEKGAPLNLRLPSGQPVRYAAASPSFHSCNDDDAWTRPAGHADAFLEYDARAGHHRDACGPARGERAFLALFR